MAETDKRQRTGPLSHLKVLDLGRIMAAPWATQMLADLGADVIKIERPGSGDDTRSWGPPFLEDRDGKPTKESGYYLSVNRAKRSVAIDLAAPEGQELVRRLAADVDIVIENFKAGALARYGLDAATLRAKHPKLIYCSITGFGQDGPRSNQAAYDFAIQAMGGLMSITGERDGQPGGGPQQVGVPVVDIMTGMYAAVAILAAVVRRNETGQGETIDLAMLDVQAAFLANQAMNFLVGGKTPQRGGNRHPNIQPQDVFACADGHLVLAVGNDGQFSKLCEAIGRSTWSTDACFARNADRVRNNAMLTGLLTERFRDFSRDDLAARLDAAGVPCAPINSIPQVFDDPQIKHRQMLRHLPHQSAGTVPQVVSPMRFKDAALSFDAAPPLLGQHTHEVLAEIGFDAAAIHALAARGII
ncbi:CaiB/BaiF CoA-transferase family protein [Bradyrhizobium sp. AUGA SZCCT0182]|uniref:CaiB/BaiF CoA transferase family protein n=1 Tax=Bradyrhizobium sp. AUGA SZCCT0182 TaxID=2807667 RepID=UPI001BAC4C68|nr:CaiB/BaiF CoA-transferase family protein [Bradyrhizobium sp. AUGA SZCCT0182]MBR1236363.1 CoA transferase [Bradyrhizobium sp. AUGA SZCCT0182]